MGRRSLPVLIHMFSLTPPKRITKGNYICDTKFHLDYLIPLYEQHNYDGGVLISGDELRFYHVNQYESKLIYQQNINQMRKHNKGGSSSNRFQRSRENKKDRIINHIVDLIEEYYYDHDSNKINVMNLLIGGPSNFISLIILYLNNISIKPFVSPWMKLMIIVFINYIIPHKYT